MTHPVRRPAVDTGLCNLCGGCVDLLPSVFILNDLGYVQVEDLPVYPEAQVDEVIALCPEDAISWEE